MEGGNRMNEVEQDMLAVLRTRVEEKNRELKLGREAAEGALDVSREDDEEPELPRPAA
jgi:hypothetical protein